MEQGGYFPAGYKFSPSPIDLVNHYLRPKVYNQDQPYIRLIYEFDFYQNGPDWLSENFIAQGVNKGVPEWYFFTPRCKKYPKGTRPTRVAGDGYWSATNGETDVEDRNKNVIAKSRNLVYYYKKDGVEEKTNWIMKEYMINDDNIELNNCVLCVMYWSDHSIRISKAMKRKKNKNLIIVDEDDKKQQNVKIRLKPPPPIQSSPLPLFIPINSVVPPLTIEAAPEQSSLQPPMDYQQPTLEYQQQVSYENGVGASNNYTQMMENQQAPVQNQQLLKENEPLFSNDEVDQHLNGPDGNTQTAQNHQPTMENQQQFRIDNNLGESYYMPMENQQQLRLDNSLDESYYYQQLLMENQQPPVNDPEAVPWDVAATNPDWLGS